MKSLFHDNFDIDSNLFFICLSLLFLIDGASIKQHLVKSVLDAFEINWDNDQFWPTTFVKKSVWNYICEVVMLPIDMITSYVEE